MPDAPAPPPKELPLGLLHGPGTERAVVERKDHAAVPVDAAIIKRDPYAGMSVQPFSSEAQKVLTAEIDTSDVEILPNGAIYLPEIKYRRRLNQAFGAGGWALIRTSDWAMQGDTLSAEFRLYVQSRFVSEVRGEQEYIAKNPNMTYASATEGAKSNALMRCCKDLGIASECWDPNFQHEWRKKWAIKVWVEGKPNPQWRRKDRDPFYKESGPVQEKPSPAATRPVHRTPEAPAAPPPPPTAPASPPTQIVGRSPAQGKPTKPTVKGPPVEDLLCEIVRIDTIKGTYKTGPNKGKDYTKFKLIVRNLGTGEMQGLDTFDTKVRDKGIKGQQSKKAVLAKITRNGLFLDVFDIVLDDDEPIVVVDDEPTAEEAAPVCPDCGCVHEPDCRSGGTPPF